MSLAQNLRLLIPLVLGLAVGGAGVAMFRESLPGAAGTAEERAEKLEVELKRAQNKLAALEASGQPGRNRFGAENIRRSLGDGARNIVQDIRDGKPVTPEDIFRASKPLMRDLAPLFDRIRVKEQRAWVDGMSGQLARKYNLSAENQAALKQWFDAKSREEAKRWSEMLGRDETRLEDVVKASRRVRTDEGLDAFMGGILTGDQLASFKKERLAERAERVQQEADMKVQRLDTLVKLDDSQREQVFAVMARGSKDYQPSMVLEGANGAITGTPAGSTKEAMLSILTPDQRAAYDAEQRRRREEAEKDLNAIGLTLPVDWDMFDEGGF